MSQQLTALLRRFERGAVDEEVVMQRLVRQPFEEALIGRCLDNGFGAGVMVTKINLLLTQARSRDQAAP